MLLMKTLIRLVHLFTYNIMMQCCILVNTQYFQVSL